ncbi:unnamed protein product [Adineta ricciae]|uniref:Uncharacterized protein n=1 Tax=Adineta ricciae TaxID=249248 RepID=A0A813VVC4_ADIRI|nr:unnamed protein product [Adineta ricciae]CAF1485616.1 unnamed protein product [Adineta ricciae]
MLLRAVDVFDIYVEPFIHSGFRLPNQPYSYYYRSLFSLHNETLSVWIHLLGTFILIGQVFHQIFHFPSGEDSMILSAYVFYNYFGACLMLLCSAQAHLLHSRTLADHIRSFYLDYFGINFYGFTSGIILYKFSFQQHFHIEDRSTDETRYYMILALFTLYSLSMACFCKIFYHRPYPLSHKCLQCSGVLLVYLYQIWPILKMLFLTYVFPDERQELNEHGEKALFWHLLQIVSFVLSGFIFVGRIPERFYPGGFDLFGQSHHTFHFTIFLMVYCQSNAVYEDILSSSSKMIEHNLIKDLLFTLLVLILQLLSICSWFRISRPAIERRYQATFDD